MALRAALLDLGDNMDKCRIGIQTEAILLAQESLIAAIRGGTFRDLDHLCEILEISNRNAVRNLERLKYED